MIDSTSTSVAAVALPVLSVCRTVLFPGMRLSVLLATPRARAALRSAYERGGPFQVAVVAARAGRTLDPGPDDLYDVGTLTRVSNLVRRPCCGSWLAELEAVERVRMCRYLRAEPFREAVFCSIQEPVEDPDVVQALALAIRLAALEIHDLFPQCEHTRRAAASVRAGPPPSALPGAVADLLLHLPVVERQRLLETEPLDARLESTLVELRRRLRLSEEDRGRPTRFRS